MRRVIPFAILLLTGCATSVKVSKVDPSKPETRVGLPYPLMFTQYEIDITRQIAGCGPELKVMVKAEVKGVTSAPDPKQLFVIDPNSLSNTFKTSDIKLEYQPNGAPSSLNAAAEDHTAQVVANVAATAVKVIAIAAAAGAPPTPGAKAEACSKPVLDARKVIEEKAPVVEAAATLVETLTADLKRKQVKATALGGDIDEASKKALVSAYDALAAATKDLAAKKEVLEKAIKVVTHVETIRWPETGVSTTGEFPLAAAVLKRWGAVDPTTAKKLKVVIELARANNESGQGGEDVIPSLGIPIRQPVQGRLKICASESCSESNLPIAEKVGDVLQLGNIYYLSCESGAFSSISCSFTTNETGQLKTIGISHKVATSEALSGTVKDLMTQAATAQETVSSAKTKRLEAETAALKAKADYVAAAAALQPDPLKDDKEATAALKASTDLLLAQKAELDAKAALAEALVNSGKGQP